MLTQKLSRKMASWVPGRPVNLKNDTPIFSITFDDFPISAADAGARVLEQANIRGTYYLCADLLDQDLHGNRIAHAEAVRNLVANGHEIACHPPGTQMYSNSPRLN